MSATALALVLTAGLVHATWNFLLKKSGGGPGVLWLVATLQAVIWAPAAIGVLIAEGYVPSLVALGFILASALLHTAYFVLLDRGYKWGDLSVVYPLARATGPLLTILVAISVLGEQPSALALAGAGLVIAGALFLTANPKRLRAPGAKKSIVFALVTGCMIASYTVVDKQAVHQIRVPPVVLDWGSGLLRAIILLPMLRTHSASVVSAWKTQRGRMLAIGALAPLSYILVLTAMVYTPVSYVAPAREISILFGALAGSLLLGEGDTPRRAIAAAIMTAGVMALALG